MERTFCIIKPDAVARNLQGEILAMIQAPVCAWWP